MTEVFLDRHISPMQGNIACRWDFSINGKILTLCQGLASIAPERKNDMEQLKDIVPIEELLWGGYIQFTFPGL